MIVLPTRLPVPSRMPLSIRLRRMTRFVSLLKTSLVDLRPARTRQRAGLSSSSSSSAAASLVIWEYLMPVRRNGVVCVTHLEGHQVRRRRS